MGSDDTSVGTTTTRTMNATPGGKSSCSEGKNAGPGKRVNSGLSLDEQINLFSVANLSEAAATHHPFGFL